MSFRITTFCIKCHYAEWRYAECRDLFILMLSVVMLIVIMLIVVMLIVIMLSVVMLSVVALLHPQWALNLSLIVEFHFTLAIPIVVTSHICQHKLKY